MDSSEGATAAEVFLGIETKCAREGQVSSKERLRDAAEVAACLTGERHICVGPRARGAVNDNVAVAVVAYVEGGQMRRVPHGLGSRIKSWL